MICPVCRDEYRPGFTRCATCHVDLVASLDAAAPPRPQAREPETSPVSSSGPLLVELTTAFCGFLSLDEARHAREALRANGLRSLIVISQEHGDEEFWLRVAPADVRATRALLGMDEVEAPEESFNCSACGALVGANDRACPGCGLEFAE